MFLSDNFLQFSPTPTNPEEQEAHRNQQRFWQIMMKLPVELQMVLCLRANNSLEVIIPHQTREEAFKVVVRRYFFDSFPVS